MRAVLLFTAIVASLTLFPQLAFGSGIEAWPPEVIMNQHNNIVGGKITVRNPSTEAQKFTVNILGGNNKIRVQPNEFTLNPEQTQNISITTSAIETIKGSKIAVVASPLQNNGLQAGAGITIPLKSAESNTTFNNIDWVSWLIYTVVIVGSLFLASLIPKQKILQ